MLAKNILPFFALVRLAISLPAAPIPPSEGLRLVKISEDDEGTWVTEDEKFDLFIAKNIHFVDITDTWVSCTCRYGSNEFLGPNLTWMNE